MSSRLIILDRDGVINHDCDHYIKSADEWLPIESSILAIARLTQAGHKVAVATNQSGLSRGYFTAATLQTIHTKMLAIVSQSGGHISAIEFCPDHPDAAGPDRKPAPGMLLRLFDRFTVTAANTWFVGDSISDILCATNAGCKPALVLTGKGKTTLADANLDPDVPIYRDLSHFADLLLV